MSAFLLSTLQSKSNYKRVLKNLKQAWGTKANRHLDTLKAIPQAEEVFASIAPVEPDDEPSPPTVDAPSPSTPPRQDEESMLKRPASLFLSAYSKLELDKPSLSISDHAALHEIYLRALAECHEDVSIADSLFDLWCRRFITNWPAGTPRDFFMNLYRIV